MPNTRPRCCAANILSRSTVQLMYSIAFGSDYGEKEWAIFRMYSIGSKHSQELSYGLLLPAKLTHHLMYVLYIMTVKTAGCSTDEI